MQNANEVIDHLAAKLQVPVSHLWDVMVRQAYVNAFEWLLFSVLTFVALRFGIKTVSKMDKDEDAWLVLTIAIAVVGGILTLVAVTGMIDAVGGVLNPEYYALEKVLEAIGGAK